MLGVVLTVLANATTHIALPSMAQAMGVSPGAMVWVVNIYLLASVVALLPLAAVGDLYGHRRVFLWSLLLFCVATLCCSLAAHTPWPLPLLLLARGFQGLGAAGIMAVCMALLRATHPSGSLGRFIGLNGMAVAASNAAGPSLAGFIVSAFSWDGLFVVLVLPGVLALGVGLRSLPKAVVRRPGRFDAWSATLQGLAIGALVVALTPLVGHWIWPAMLFSLVMTVLFVRRESREGHPLLPLDLLRRPLFAASFAAAYACFVAQMLALVSLPFLMQSRLGLAPAAMGLAMTPWPLTVMITAPIAGMLSDRFSTVWMGSTGLLLAAAGLWGLACMETGASVIDMAWRMGLTGFGFALFTGSNTRALMAATPHDRSGAVGGMHAVSRQSGQLVGAAIAGQLLSQATVGVGAERGLLLAAGISVLAALACGFKPRGQSHHTI
jgi:DHA2 family multidrug resistance protein-like MFS transporter